MLPLRHLLSLSLLSLVAPALRADEVPTATTAPATGEAASATEAAPAPKTRAERLAELGVKTTVGPAVVKLGEQAEFTLKEGQLFVGPDSLDRFYQLTENTRGGDEVGVVMGQGFSLFFDFKAVGYVKDDEKDDLKADALLASMKESEIAANEERKKRGWDEVRILGWAHQPFYDEKTQNLKWAINLSSSADNHQSTWINESIRVLGRSGYMNVTLSCDQSIYAQVSPLASQQLQADFRYLAGERYSEFKSGDKVAEYGLTALVLGGGAIAAAKMGLFGHLASFFTKLGKGIVLVIVGIGAAIAKFFRKVTGSHQEGPKNLGS